MAGDFNFPEIDWSSLGSGTVASSIMLDFLFTFNLSQLVSTPTRIQGASRTILDLIFVTDHFLRGTINIHTHEGLSDHELVVCTLPLPNVIRSHRPFKSVHVFNRADDAAILTYLAHEFPDFYDLCTNEQTSIDEAWLQFKAHIGH